MGKRHVGSQKGAKPTLYFERALFQGFGGHRPYQSHLLKGRRCVFIRQIGRAGGMLRRWIGGPTFFYNQIGCHQRFTADEWPTEASVQLASPKEWCARSLGGNVKKFGNIGLLLVELTFGDHALGSARALGETLTQFAGGLTSTKQAVAFVALRSVKCNNWLVARRQVSSTAVRWRTHIFLAPSARRVQLRRAVVTATKSMPGEVSRAQAVERPQGPHRHSVCGAVGYPQGYASQGNEATRPSRLTVASLASHFPV